MNSLILAGKLGLSGAPVGAPGGGSNYANGGAYTETPGPNPPNVPVVQQIKNYLIKVNGAANPNAIYVVKSGDNDLNYPTSGAATPAYLQQSASALAAEVAILQAAGARAILVPNSYNSAVFADTGGVISGSNTILYQKSVAYGMERWASLRAAGVHFIPADLDSVFSYVAKNPTLFGFTTYSVLSFNAPNFGPPSTSALISILPYPEQRTFLFIDGLHLTTAGQTIEADYEYSLITAPSQISLIAESAVQIGLGHAATIQRQIELFDQQRGPSGINVWVSSGADSLQIKNASNFPDASGIPFSGTVGVDYLTPIGVVVGAVFTGGSETQEFSTGGNFDQVDEAMSLYAAYKYGPVWGDAVATYGLFQDTINRQVALGIHTDQNHGDTTGQDLALALRAGGDFSLGRVTTGPVAGVIMQQVHVNGFTETGASRVTDLSFHSQTRNSLVSTFGWRVSVDAAKWHPFAEATWNHEWADKDRMITASLNSVQTVSYRVAAAPVASDWATAAVGTSYKLNSQVMLHCALTAEVFNPQVVGYGGELGLTTSF